MRKFVYMSGTKPENFILHLVRREGKRRNKGAANYELCLAITKALKLMQIWSENCFPRIGMGLSFFRKLCQ